MTGSARTIPPRGRLRADLVYLGWRATQPELDPALPALEPPPGRPFLAEVSPGWLAAQRREHALRARPARIGAAAGTTTAAVAAGCWLAAAIPAWLAGLVVAAGVAAAAAALRSLIAARRALRAQLSQERNRIARFRAAQQAQLAARAAEHRKRGRAERARRPGWYPVAIPVTVGRVDVAGGTLRGWSALLTSLAAPRLAAGAEVTVLDLTEGAVAADLLAAAASWGISSQVWVLPADLPRLDLGLRLAGDSLADVLALTAAAAGQTQPAADPARDAAMLSGLLDVLGPGASVPQLITALRALAQIGGPRAQSAAGLLGPQQLTALSTWSGRGAQQLVIDRAWALEARFRPLMGLGSALSPRPPSPLRVASIGRSGTAVGNRVIAAYLAVALTEVLRQAPAAPPWQQAICVLGADRLPGDVLDRLCDAAEAAGPGLVLGYRSIPAPVRERLGRGNAAVAFMRVGNAAEAQAAAEQIGTEHRFVLSQLTDTIGSSVTDTVGDSYTSTFGLADSVSSSVSASLTAGRSRGRGSSGHCSFTPFADVTRSASGDVSASAAVTDSRAVTESINASTSWGLTTSRAVGANSSLAGTLQRCRELVVEQHELQHLPQTAVLVCQGGAAGREVVLADANPAIMTLPNATLAGAGPRLR